MRGSGNGLLILMRFRRGDRVSWKRTLLILLFYKNTRFWC